MLSEDSTTQVDGNGQSRGPTVSISSEAIRPERSTRNHHRRQGKAHSVLRPIRATISEIRSPVSFSSAKVEMHRSQRNIDFLAAKRNQHTETVGNLKLSTLESKPRRMSMLINERSKGASTAKSAWD
ncbi:uncharacterized protein PADG_12060 [Paracoccidioides brasiliensis Pb18]|uniref:Uncharacterized protein n=1 Tax=Paracoccidioides brasiliensis (strain Pb18) TaxID=502780 RepID=A0A0A0HRF8_PARBD|nr:uncharacterized protein PADG_12060 [Paracoccidioides brasiliensis Pb18]KGM91754.1 hypothetical protein PADG_12060 [Paracoccidioides brasiliensis Pb18]